MFSNSSKVFTNLVDDNMYDDMGQKLEFKPAKFSILGEDILQVELLNEGDVLKLDPNGTFTMFKSFRYEDFEVVTDGIYVLKVENIKDFCREVACDESMFMVSDIGDELFVRAPSQLEERTAVKKDELDGAFRVKEERDTNLLQQIDLQQLSVSTFMLTDITMTGQVILKENVLVKIEAEGTSQFVVGDLQGGTLEFEVGSKLQSALGKLLDAGGQIGAFIERNNGNPSILLRMWEPGDMETVSGTLQESSIALDTKLVAKCLKGKAEIKGLNQMMELLTPGVYQIQIKDKNKNALYQVMGDEAAYTSERVLPEEGTAELELLAVKNFLIFGVI